MANPLIDFLKTKGITPPTTTFKPTTTVTAPLTPTALPKVTALDVVKEMPSAASSSLRWLGKELMKPISTVAVTTEQIGKVLGGADINELKQIPKKATDILTGKTERSFSDIWRESLPSHPTAGTVIGTIMDIVADPLNFSGGAIVKGFKYAGKTVARVPGVTGALEATKPMFTTATHNKEFDQLIQHYRDLGDFRRAEILDGARNIQKEIAKLKTEEIIQVSEKIEKGIKSSNPAINNLADNLSKTYKEWKILERSMGIRGGELAQYAPHIPAFMGKEGGIRGIVREFSSRLGGAEKQRKILKFVSEDGEELIGKAENLGLKETTKGFKKVIGKTEKGKNILSKEIYQPQQASIDEINRAFEKTFFEENPAIQMAYRGMSHVKAVTGKEFFQGVKKFATNNIGDVVSTAPELKGLKFEPEIATAIDTYYKSIKPEEIRAVFKLYDNILGWWKAQALMGPAYHTRNAVSNIWNTFLAGVKTPTEYIQAGLVQIGKKIKFTDDVGKVWTEKSLLDAAKRTGVINQGWYAADIPQAIEAEIFKGNWNPLSQRFKAFKLNRQIGTAIENNARLALFINQIKKGKSIDHAAMTVKKYLFNYADLTTFEKTWMKRIFPFWTWCVSADTECLTLNGWKKHFEINVGDIILTYNLYKKIWEWLPVEDKFESPYNYKLFHFFGKSIDLLCTFDHNCVTQRGLRPAYTLSFLDTCPMKIKYIKKDYNISDRILKLICWIVTDGYSRVRKNYFEAVIYQKKQKYLKEIKKLIGKDCGKESIHPQTGVSCMRINGNTRKEILTFYCGKNDLWNLFINLSARQLKICQDTMMKAEGSCSYKDTIREFKHFSQSLTKNKDILDVFQLTTILGGTISRISERGIYLRTQKNVSYKLKTESNIVNYNGIIWCPSTKNKTWVARRNGKVLITGNTSKNIPLQLEHLIREPGKYAGLEKVIRSIEQISMGDSKPANEKYLSDYIKNNTAMRAGYNEKEKIYYYFLLGNWLPSFQMQDFLSQPMENLMQMLTPVLKTPMEMLVNKSLFFRNTLGDYQTIENYPGESINFLGFNMPKKSATFLRNIRLLNELDKLNPGKIFGGKPGGKSIWAKAKLPVVEIPKLGIISPALEKYKKTMPAPTAAARTAGLFLGKLQSYKEKFSRNFYQMDTQRRVDEIKRNIKSAARKGDKERIKLLNQQLRNFIKERGL